MFIIKIKDEIEFKEWSKADTIMSALEELGIIADCEELENFDDNTEGESLFELESRMYFRDKI